MSHGNCGEWKIIQKQATPTPVCEATGTGSGATFLAIVVVFPTQETP